MRVHGKFQAAKLVGSAGLISLLLLSAPANAHEDAKAAPQPATQVMLGDEPSDAMTTGSVSIPGKICKSEQASLRMPIVEAGTPDEAP